MNDHVVADTKGYIITNPPIAHFLFDDTRFAVVWLVVRVLLGWQWVEVRLIQTEDGAGSALQIESANGQTATIKLSSTVTQG